MLRKSIPMAVAGLALCCLLSSCAQEKQAPAPVQISSELLQAFEPLPAVIESAENPLTEEKITLGRMLYYESRLSKNHDVSCNSCHDLTNYGVDSQPLSDGHRKQLGDRNSPTVYNAAGHFVQFWDGRAAHVEEQAMGPIMNPVEMAMPGEARVVATLSSMPEYVDLFKKTFPGEKKPISLTNAAKAIGAFERKLVTPSRWDDFLKGKADALTEQEKKGFVAFTDVGCQACHMGAYIGGSMYQKMGAAKPWTNTSDPGRFRITGREEDRMLFKVPSLRNVEKTAPYYHNGSVPTLEQAVAAMGEFQLARTLSNDQVQLITAWLKTLTGTIPVDYIKPPLLPESTPRTPKPEAD